MSFENIFDRFIQRQQRKHWKDVEANIPELQRDHIYKILPNEKTMTDRESMKYIKNLTNWDEQTIVSGLNELIKKRKVISVYDKYQNVYVTKNPY